MNQTSNKDEPIILMTMKGAMLLLLLDDNPTPKMQELKYRIAETLTERGRFTTATEAWTFLNTGETNANALCDFIDAIWDRCWNDQDSVKILGL